MDGAPAAAFLQAKPDATPQEIMAVREALAINRLPAEAVTVDGKQFLQVENIGSIKTILDILKAQNFIHGNATVTEDPADNIAIPKRTFLERYGLKTAGALNLIGDIAMHAGGYGEVTGKVLKGSDRLDPEKVKQTRIKGYFDLAGGGLYTLGGLNLIAYGNEKNDAPPLSERTDEFLKHTLNPEAATPQTPQKKVDILRERAADVTLSTYVGGASVFLAKGYYGYKHSPSKKWSDMLLMGYGTTSLMCKALALKIKEKPHHHDQDEQQQPQNIIDWCKEKPLRIFGWGSFAVDSLYAAHAFSDFREWRSRPVAERGAKIPANMIFKGITSATYLASDYLMANSSKNAHVDPLTPDQKRAVVAHVAEVIMAQPAENQEPLVDKAATFLSKQPEMCEGRKSVRQSILEQTKNLAQNPWSLRLETAADKSSAMKI